MIAADFTYGFRVVGDCRQARRLIDWSAAFAAYAAVDPRAECGRESYLSAFTFGADFREHLNATGTTAAFNGPCWSPWLWSDVDARDLSAALDATRRIVTAAVDGLGFDENDPLVFFSGSKGFHIGLSTAAWSPSPSVDFARVAKHFAQGLAERAGVTIDAGVYDKARLFRAPNSRHSRTGLHKRRLTCDELMRLSIDAILRLAERPEPFEIPPPTHRSERTAALWNEAAALVQREAADRAARLANAGEPRRLNRATIDFVREGAPVGERHRRLYSASADLGGLGASLPLCVALLEEAALDSGLAPTDARRAIANGWASVQPTVREAIATFGGEVVDVRPTSANPSASAATDGAP